MKSVFFLVFVIITIVRALKSAADEKKLGQRVDANAPERRRRVQSEIDAFLTEVSDGKPAPSAQANQQKSEQQRQLRTQQRRQQQAQQQYAADASQRQAPLERQANNSLTPQQSLESGINEYVDPYRSQHVAEHIETDVDGVVQTHIVDSMESHLGNRSAELPSLTSTDSTQPTSASEFRKLLKSRSGVRQAVLLNEVLNRPRSLRR
jgi:cell division protein FtsN